MEERKNDLFYFVYKCDIKRAEKNGWHNKIGFVFSGDAQIRWHK